MPQYRTESGAPDDHVHRFDVIAEDQSGGGESVEHRVRHHHAAVAGGFDRRHHHDVAESGDATGIGFASCDFTGMFTRDVEKDPAVDVVGQESWFPRRQPECLGDGGDFGDDLRSRVSAADDSNLATGERCRRFVAGGMDLGAGELADTGGRSARTVGATYRWC